MSVRPLLIDLLAHPERVSPERMSECPPAELVACAVAERVVPLAASMAARVAPRSAQTLALRAESAAWALREAAERRAIGEWLDRLPSFGIDARAALLFFKGAATAYSVYAEPWHRMRDDWDILVVPSLLGAVERSLTAEGFRRDPALKPGRVRMRQHSYRRPVAGGDCVIDLHWRLVNPPSLAERIRFDDLALDARPLSGLHPAARGTGAEASMVIACLHRLAHHSDDSRLSWDAELLRLLECIDGKPDPLSLARAWQLEAFVAAEVMRAASVMDTPIGADVARALADVPRAERDAPFLVARGSRAREFALDWRALDWRDRASLVRETLLPDAAFMRASTGSRAPLPLLYAARVVRGLWGWVSSSRDARPPRPD